MQPLKKTHLCVLKKYLAVAALSCAASVVSVKSMAATKNLDIELTAKVPEKEFKLQDSKIELTMEPDTENEVFKGKTDIRYLNHEKVQGLKVTLYQPMNPVLNPESLQTTRTIGIDSILIKNKELVGNSGVSLTPDDLASTYQAISLEIISESYKEVPEGKYKGTVTLQFDANM